MSKATISKYYKELEDPKIKEKVLAITVASYELGAMLDRLLYEKPMVIDIHCEHNAYLLYKEKHIEKQADKIVKMYEELEKKQENVIYFYKEMKGYLKEDSRQVKSSAYYSNLLKIANLGIKWVSDIIRCSQLVDNFVTNVEAQLEHKLRRQVAEILYVEAKGRVNTQKITLLNNKLDLRRMTFVTVPRISGINRPQDLTIDNIEKFLGEGFVELKMYNERLKGIAEIYKAEKERIREEKFSTMDFNREELEGYLETAIRKYEDNKNNFKHISTVWENQLVEIAKGYFEEKSVGEKPNEYEAELALNLAKKMLLVANNKGVPRRNQKGLAELEELANYDINATLVSVEGYHDRQATFLLHYQALGMLGKALYHDTKIFYKVSYTLQYIKLLYIPTPIRVKSYPNLINNINTLEPLEVRDFFEDVWAYNEGRELEFSDNWYNGLKNVLRNEPSEKEIIERLYAIVRGTGDTEALEQAEKLLGRR